MVVGVCLEQVEGDIAGEKQEIEDAKQGIVDLRKELAKLTTKCNATQVGVSGFLAFWRPPGDRKSVV